MKKEFREKALQMRNSLGRADLCEKVMSLSEYKSARTVFIYISFGSEIETTKLIEAALKEKTVLVPYCVDTNGSMIACKIDSFSDLKPGKFGIPEPVNPIGYEGDIDLTVVPGAAFSKEGFRIGYGKGYYDRFLAENKTFAVGLCHRELLYDKIPYDEYDIRLDMIITDREEIRI